MASASADETYAHEAQGSHREDQGKMSRTLGRHAEIGDMAARKFFDQFGGRRVAMSVTVTITAERGNGVWVLESDNGAVSQVRSLQGVRDEMLEAVAHLAGVPEPEVEIGVDVRTPDAYTEAIAEAQRLRAESEAANRQSAAALRRAVRALVDAGISYRDAAQLMWARVPRHSWG